MTGVFHSDKLYQLDGRNVFRKRKKNEPLKCEFFFLLRGALFTRLEKDLKNQHVEFSIPLAFISNSYKESSLGASSNKIV